MKHSFIQLVTGLAALALFATGSAYAQNNNKGGGTTPTPVGPTVIPGGAFASTYVITSPGSYILGGNRSTDGSMHVIEVQAPNVTVDLNGFELSQTNPAGNAGVYAANVQNLEVRNGTISHTGIGVRCAYNNEGTIAGIGLRVVNVRVSDSASGVNTAAVAALVDHCEMINCNIGISVAGLGSVVTDCVVYGSSAIGVDLGSASRVTRTLIRDCKWGIYMSSGNVTDSSVLNCKTGLQTYYPTTLRNVDIQYNTMGVVTGYGETVLVGCRMVANTTNFQGPYTNGGGNFIL
jgi:hypothetical protein